MQENNNDDDSMPLTKTKTKKSEEKPNLKKIRSQKQIDAFNNTMKIRAQKVEERKQQKLLESAKILVEKHSTIKSNKVAPVMQYEVSSEDQSTESLSFYSKKDKVTSEKKYFSDESSSSEEEEIIVVKNKSKIKEKHTKEKHKKEKHKKKPSKKTIIFDSSSDESSSDSSGGSEEYIKASKRTTERVKRKETVIEQPPIKTLSKPEDFRVYFI